MVPAFFNKKERDFDSQINIEQDEKHDEDETSMKEVFCMFGVEKTSE